MAEATTITVKGKALKCQICGKEKFLVKDTVLNEKWYAIFDAEWAGKTAKAYICENCGLVHEFIDLK